MVGRQIRDIPQGLDVLLGEKFIFMPRRSIAASHTGHGVIFGIYDGKEVAAKPFYGKHATDKAGTEARMIEVVHKLGFKTPQHVTTLSGEALAIFMTGYIGGLIGGNALSLDASPVSATGRNTAVAVRGIATTLANAHNQYVTLGDPQPKNFGFSQTEPLSQEPWIFDLEKSTRHSKASRFIGGALRREMKRLSYSLGAQAFGGSDQSEAHRHFTETVVDPYANSLEGNLLRDIKLLPIIAQAETAFADGRYHAFSAARPAPIETPMLTPIEA